MELRLTRRVALALLGMSMTAVAGCSNESLPTTDTATAPAKPAFLVIPGPSTPEAGKIKICKQGNVDGTFALSNTIVNGGTPTVVSSPTTVATGSCAVVVTDMDPANIGSFTTITETSAGFQSASAVFIDGGTGVTSTPAYVNGSTALFLNQFHGWVITYVNNVVITPPPPPPPTTVGCSPGYWKNHSNWPAPYSPNELFSAAGFDNAFPGMTLQQVLANGGGGLTALGRQTVGALLNAAALAPWDKTAAQVKSDFNAVFPGSKSDYTALQTTFENLTDINGRTCPLN